MPTSPFERTCLQDQVILITGGCGALGRVIVESLRSHGARLVVNDILSDEDAEALLPRAANLLYLQADVTQEEQVTELFDRSATRFGTFTTVLCHAGASFSAPFPDYPLEEWKRLLDLNLTSAFLVSREAVRRMKEWSCRDQPGRILFTSSWVENVPWPEISAYNASKAGLRMLMRSVAREAAGHHILCNGISPGIVAAGMALKQWGSDPSYRARARRAIPLGYLQSPESVAQAFVFLCSEASRYMTGATLLVDGGCSLYPMDPTNEV
jgi:NAD(P)-dependent dehydrogenase (short-subunit alcohol dehydrogenase family)